MYTIHKYIHICIEEEENTIDTQRDSDREKKSAHRETRHTFYGANEAWTHTLPHGPCTHSTHTHTHTQIISYILYYLPCIRRTFTHGQNEGKDD